jgi:beta-glucosidase
MTSPMNSIDDVLQRLTLAEKVDLCTGADIWSTVSYPELGLGGIRMSDGPIGVRGVLLDDSETSACLPSASALAASWNPDLFRRLGGLLAAEARRKDVDVVLGPTINLHRSPIGGRHFEAYSESPLLSGVLAAEYVLGVQENGVAACPKHFVANDSETLRDRMDVHVDESALRETYLLPFEIAQHRAQPWSIMSAYPSVNGAAMAASPLVTEVLEDEWGFDGAVISDWTALREAVPGALGGLDIAMPGPDSAWSRELLAAIGDGRVPESAVDEKVRRILRLAERVGRLDTPATIVDAWGTDDVATILREAAASGTVLLTNDGTLPLDRTALRRVALIGPNGLAFRALGGGSARVRPDVDVSLVEALTTTFGPDVELILAQGAPLPRRISSLDVTAVVEAWDAAGTSLTTTPDTEGILRLHSGELEHAARIRVTFALPEALDGMLSVSGLGTMRVTIDGETVIDEHHEASPDADFFFAPPVTLGTVPTPGARHAVFEWAYDSISPRGELRFGLEPIQPDAETLRAQAMEAAASADLVLVVVGTDETIESEGYDRTDLRLPAGQDALVETIAAVDTPTVVIVNAGAPVELPWRDSVSALLLTWFPGQEGSSALADVLVGDTEPGGRLPTTWPATIADVPVLNTTPVDGILEYSEGSEIGIAAWDAVEAAPAFALGHGLGYTRWDYGSATISGLIVDLTLHNTGTRSGTELVQAYLAATPTEPRRLAGWSRADAAADTRTTLSLELDPFAFGRWETGTGWIVDLGDRRLAVGASSADSRFDLTLTIDDTVVAELARATGRTYIARKALT